MADEIFTVKEAAEYLKVSTETVYKLLRSGELEGRKVGRAWRIHKDRLKEYVKSSNS